MKKVLAFVVTLLFLCFPRGGWSAPAAELDGEIAIQEKARDELNKKIQQYNETAQKKAQQARGLLGRITNLQQDSKMAQQQIKLLELQSNKLQRSMMELNQEIETTSRRVDSLIGELRVRVVNMYKYGSREGLNLLLSAENTHEAVASAYLLRRLSRYDQVVIEELLAKVAELEQGKRSMEKNREQLSARTKELNAQRERNDSSINETNMILSGIQRDRQKAEAAVKEMERAQQEIGRTIFTLLEKKKGREPEGKKPQTALAVPAPQYPALGRGSLLDWPLQGAIDRPYGSHVHPVFKTKSFNSGIDIRAASGTPVKAAGPGQVLFEGWLRGFGQVVIIDHGQNISTVYAHLASTRVKEQDAVRPGTVIGTVGNTGTTESYGLHFEVRVKESAKNPLDYLKKA
ncbi:MAG: peptidoglycan DD-metalloendopeptidase family protein [Synergistaceae bacterium]|jgi:murein DD-endopeptidase MepM/ murein hydrolase activator NlpD|nr:peptidoglycan DD-metalloendopeptidase family protein [Synergistaceae bacterium]